MGERKETPSPETDLPPGVFNREELPGQWGRSAGQDTLLNFTSIKRER